jgi:hypothetical protein
MDSDFLKMGVFLQTLNSGSLIVVCTAFDTLIWLYQVSSDYKSAAYL